jgi:hypothetical protein
MEVYSAKIIELNGGVFKHARFDDTGGLFLLTSILDSEIPMNHHKITFNHQVPIKAA